MYVQAHYFPSQAYPCLYLCLSRYGQIPLRLCFPLLAEVPRGITACLFLIVEQASVVWRQRKILLDSEDQIWVGDEVSPKYNGNILIFVLLIQCFVCCFRQV